MRKNNNAITERRLAAFKTVQLTRSDGYRADSIHAVLWSRRRLYRSLIGTNESLN